VAYVYRPQKYIDRQRNYVLVYYRSDVPDYTYVHIQYMLRNLGEEMNYLDAFADGHTWQELGEMMIVADRLRMLKQAYDSYMDGGEDIEAIVNTD
jgi:hypothetical protein